MSTNRAALISKTHRVLKKHYKPFSPPAERSLFEHILYGCLLQNSAADQADQADWPGGPAAEIGDSQIHRASLPARVRRDR